MQDVFFRTDMGQKIVVFLKYSPVSMEHGVASASLASLFHILFLKVNLPGFCSDEMLAH